MVMRLGLTGKELKKYIESGIESDHECSTFEEAKEKLDVINHYIGMEI